MTESRPIAFSATNPCHVWDQVKGLHALGFPVHFFSGYPSQRLPGLPADLSVSTHSLSTLLTYGITKWTGRSNALARCLYRLQDISFDARVAAHLSDRFSQVIAIPGQALKTFQTAHRLGIRSALNHASGPVEVQQQILRELAIEAGLPDRTADGIHTTDRLRAERGLADRHLVASHIVTSQLAKVHVAKEQIFTAPYGVDPEVFKKSLEPHHGPFRLLFAGQLHPRKGLLWLLDCWSQRPADDVELTLIGPSDPLFTERLSSIAQIPRLAIQDSISQTSLAVEMAQSDALILPSAEEAFGLVVPQALQCGTPCIVSDRVGAKDLITDPKLGEVVPYGDSHALHMAIDTLKKARPRVSQSFTFLDAARRLGDILETW